MNTKQIFETLKGQRVMSLDLDDYEVTLELDSGYKCTLSLEGDCCSTSFFNCKEDFNELLGCQIQSVEERSNGTPKKENPPEGFSTDNTIWYFLVFETDKGHLTIDWRNESNGYYAGYLTAEYAESESVEGLKRQVATLKAVLGDLLQEQRKAMS